MQNLKNWLLTCANFFVIIKTSEDFVMFYKRDKQEILRLARQIKPVVKAKKPGKHFSEGGLFYILPVDIYQKGFRKNEECLCKANGVYKLAKIDTLHILDNGNQFRPSIEEVLQQIPEEYLDKTVAFSITTKQEIEVAGVEKEECFMKAQTTLYGLEEGRQLPFCVEKQYVIMGDNVIFCEDAEKTK